MLRYGGLSDGVRTPMPIGASDRIRRSDSGVPTQSGRHRSLSGQAPMSIGTGIGTNKFGQVGARINSCLQQKRKKTLPFRNSPYQIATFFTDDVTVW
ncbi:MAG: hypothetical protein AAB019_08810 [Planctomycetota bacterium]